MGIYKRRIVVNIYVEILSQILSACGEGGRGKGGRLGQVAGGKVNPENKFESGE